MINWPMAKNPLNYVIILLMLTLSIVGINLVVRLMQTTDVVEEGKFE